MERSRFTIPAVPADALARPSLTTWFDAYARVPLRYVVGQPGAGAWISLRAGATDSELFSLLAEVLTPGETPPRTIVVDDIDRAAPAARALLAELYLQSAASVQFVYVARALSAVDVSEGEQRGVAAIADGRQLAFGIEDIALFCEVLGVAFNQRDCARLQTATGGWALAVTGAVRAAKAAGVSLREGLEHWRIAHGRTVERIVAEALKAAPARDAQDLLDILEAITEPAPATLRRLARAGLFVEAIEGTQAINPIVADGRLTRSEAAPQAGPLVLEMFGRFQVVHEGREVRFVRRRDAQIVQYLALQPQGRATRAELIRTFWPDADPQLGAQGLRTACSAIRRAIAMRVGAAAVDRYLFSGPAQIGLRFDAVVSSTHRFALHADLAVAAEARGALTAAYSHWTAALQLYTAPVLSGEPFAWWIEQRAATFEILRARGRRFVREATGAGTLA